MEAQFANKVLPWVYDYATAPVEGRVTLKNGKILKAGENFSYNYGFTVKKTNGEVLSQNTIDHSVNLPIEVNIGDTIDFSFNAYTPDVLVGDPKDCGSDLTTNGAICSLTAGTLIAGDVMPRTLMHSFYINKLGGNDGSDRYQSNLYYENLALSDISFNDLDPSGPRFPYFSFGPTDHPINEYIPFAFNEKPKRRYYYEKLPSLDQFGAIFDEDLGKHNKISYKHQIHITPGMQAINLYFVGFNGANNVNLVLPVKVGDVISDSSFTYVTNKKQINFTANDWTAKSYTWDFGDGTTINGTKFAVNHTYQNAGRYQIKLTIIDRFGKTATTTVPVTVSELQCFDTEILQDGMCVPKPLTCVLPQVLQGGVCVAPLAAPEISSATSGDGQVVLSWGNVNDATSHDICYAPEAITDPMHCTNVSNNATALLNQSSPTAIKGLTNGTTYHFVVTAIRGTEKVSSVEMMATPQAPTPASDGLVGYWNFDDCIANNGIANDSSGLAHHGQIQGNPQCVNGIKGKGLLFNGSTDYIVVGSDNNFPANAITISYWINRNGNAVNNPLENYISKEYAFQSYVRGDNGGKFESGFYLNNPGFWTGYSSGSYGVGTNDIVHYALTFDNTTKTAKTYINGQLVNTVLESDPNGIVRLSNEALYIGRNGSANVYYIKGILDEVRLHNRALSDAEIQAIYVGDGGIIPTPGEITANIQAVACSLYQCQNIPLVNTISNGIAYASPSTVYSAVGDSYYWTSFHLTFNQSMDVDGLEAKIRFKAPLSEGAIQARDFSIVLGKIKGYDPSGAIYYEDNSMAYAGFMGDSWGYSWTGIAVFDYREGPYSEYLLPMDDWHDMSMVFEDGDMVLVHDGSALKTMPYTAGQHLIDGMGINFKGSASIDWISLSKNGAEIYRKDF